MSHTISTKLPDHLLLEFCSKPCLKFSPNPAACKLTSQQDYKPGNIYVLHSTYLINSK